jgi:NDP-sugar pyrophosphorylase family protein
MRTAQLYDLSHTMAKELLLRHEYPWLCLSELRNFGSELVNKLAASDNYYLLCDGVVAAKSAVISKSATIYGPAVIGEECEIRCGAFIRGSAIIGEGCVVGNSCEIKNSLLFDRVQVPHFNYIGDSILGYRSHTGAGAITSNGKSDKTLVCVRTPDGPIETGLKKFGAMLGDFVEVGCNSVLNPGTVIGRNTNVYPLSSVRGTVPENSIFKSQNNIVLKSKKQ